jgi:hypothetical protein
MSKGVITVFTTIQNKELSRYRLIYELLFSFIYSYFLQKKSFYFGFDSYLNTCGENNEDRTKPIKVDTIDLKNWDTTGLKFDYF